MKRKRYHKLMAILISMICLISYTGCISGFFMDVAHLCAYTKYKKSYGHDIVEKIKDGVLASTVESEDNWIDFKWYLITYSNSFQLQDALRNIVVMCHVFFCLWRVLQGSMQIPLERLCHELRVCKEGDGKKKTFLLIA